MARSVEEHAIVINAIAAGQTTAAQAAMTSHVNLLGEEIVGFLRTFGTSLEHDRV
jgi:DNA-binding GntR family transcriptional regulator